MMTKSRFLSLALIAGTFFTSLPVEDAFARPAGAYSYRPSSSSSYSSRSYSAPVRSSSGYGGSRSSSASSSSSYRMSSTDRSSLGTASRGSYDDYRRSQAPAPVTPPVRSTPPTRTYSPPTYSQPSYAQTAPAPAQAAPQREGMSPLTAGVIGAMAGHILSEHSNDRRDYSAPAPGPTNFGDGYQGQTPSPYGAPAPSVGSVAPAPSHMSAPVSHATPTTGSHGFGLVLFLILFVLLIIGVVMFFLFRNKSRSPAPPYKDTSWGADSWGGEAVKSSKDADFGLHIGGGVTIPLLETSSPASSAMEPLHFEPDARGSRSIVSVMKSMDTREMELNLDKDGNDFIRIDADGGTKFFSILDEVFPANRDEWDEWLNEENGILGLPTFITPKRSLSGHEWPETQWSRCLLAQHADRLAPQRILFQLADGSSGRTAQIEMLETVYFRQTGYPKGYPQIEYLMVRVKNVTGSQRTTSITIHAGTDVTKSSLGLSAGI